MIVMTSPSTDAVREEMERIHAEYSAKMRALFERQKALEARIARRLDDEQAARTKRGIVSGDQIT